MNEISISRETYSEIVIQKFTLYNTASLPLLKDYMDTSRSEWEEDKDFTAHKVRKQKQGQKILLVVQGTLIWKRPVGMPQAIRPREADRYLTKQ